MAKKMAGETKQFDGMEDVTDQALVDLALLLKKEQEKEAKAKAATKQTKGALIQKMHELGVDKFRVIPTDGGSVELLFRVGTSDISEAEGGALFGMLGQEVMVSITAPVIASGAPIIDGSNEAFKADHPEAGDLFAQGASDQHAGDFGTADDTGAPGAGDSDEPNWPEPGVDSEGGETDQAGDAAEFEAGMQKALDSAGVAPKSARRGRRPADTIQ